MKLPEELERRTLEILRSVIDEHLSSGGPVGSRTVSKQAGFGLSAATIRNVMADLEEAGLLAQPHTSAGRVPTARALRWYVEQLPKHPLAGAEEALIQESLDRARSDLQGMLDIASRLLASLTHYAGVIVMPRIDAAVLAHVDFVRLESHRILVMLATTAGTVQHKVIDVREDYAADELVRLSRFVAEKFRGMTLREARHRTEVLLQEDRAEFDRLTRAAMELAGQTFRGGDPEPDVHIEGTLNILDAPEFADAGKVRSLLATLEDKEKILRILDAVIHGQGLQVIIGAENPIAEMAGISLVTAAYGSGATAGALGVIGPTRMDYDRTVSVVDRMAEVLSRCLSGEEPGAGEGPAGGRRPQGASRVDV